MFRLIVTLALLLAAVTAAPAAAQAVRAGAPQKGRKVAFLVGVGAFKHGLPDLNGSPQKDVAELGRVLKEGGFEVVTLTDKDATRADVERRFREAVKPLGKGDILLAAVCTHGFTLPPAAGRPDAPFLAAHDSRPGQADTMISLNGLTDAGKGSGATILFLVDACREIVDQNRGIEPTQVTLPKGTAVLLSCGRGELSHQSEKADGHGLFTYAVLQTLRGNRGIKDEVSWTGLVHEVERALRSDEFKRMIPAGKVQTPFEAKGELAYTELLDVVVVPLAEELRAYRRAGPPGPRGNTARLEYLRKEAPARLAVWRAGAEKGDTVGQILYATCLLDGCGVPKNEPEGVKWLKKAGDGGNGGAMAHLARLYEAGRGVPKSDADAFQWQKKAADTAGAPPRVGYTLGRMYEEGRGTPKNEVEAARLYRAAADGGLPPAMVSLAALYNEGRGVRKDPVAGSQWNLKAAEAGDVVGMGRIGWAYESGWGVPKNVPKAIEWYEKAKALDEAAGREFYFAENLKKLKGKKK